MPIKHRYFNDVYAEIEYETEVFEHIRLCMIQSLSIYHLLNNGEISYTNTLHTIIDFESNKFLLDMAIFVDENGEEGSKLI